MNIKLLLGIFIVGLLAGLVPFGMIALARSHASGSPPIHPDQDMFKQQKFKSQRGDAMFADGRAMRPRVEHTTASTDLTLSNEIVNDPDDPNNPYVIGKDEAPISLDDETSYKAVVEGVETGSDGKPAYVKKFPVPVSMNLLKRGQERYTIYCSVCHGQAGYGDGTVAIHAAQLQEAGGNIKGWVAPKNYHTDDMRQEPIGQIFNTITNGVRTMPAYAKQISVLDRWAIVAYVKALQRSQDAKAKDIPEAERAKEK